MRSHKPHSYGCAQIAGVPQVAGYGGREKEKVKTLAKRNDGALGVSVDDVKRDIEFLERTGVIVKVGFSESGHSCNGCTGCGTGKKICAGCMPEGGFKNMGYMWEVK